MICLQNLFISSDDVDLLSVIIISYERGDIYVKDRINDSNTKQFIESAAD